MNTPNILIRVHHLTSSRAWALSKTFSLANYAWFVLGVFWVFTSTHCNTAPLLFHATLGVVKSCKLLIFTLF